MARLEESLRFNNVRSVRFDLDSFAVPVNANLRRRNTIYTAVLSNMTGRKNQLLPTPAVDNRGFPMTARWRHWTFAGNPNTGTFASNAGTAFQLVSNIILPRQMVSANDRIFMTDHTPNRVIYTVDLRDQWVPSQAIGGVFYIPEGYGRLLRIGHFRTDLLLVCEGGLLAVNRSLNIRHLTYDSETVINNIVAGGGRVWESHWFSLGYAIDTQRLREVLIQTNVPIRLSVISNRLTRTITVQPSDKVQRNRIFLRGDQFKIRILVPDGDFEISNLVAAISFGTHRQVK